MLVERCITTPAINQFSQHGRETGIRLLSSFLLSQARRSRYDPYEIQRTISHVTQARYSSTTTPKFTYRIASAYSAKGGKLNPERDMFKWNPYNRFQPMTSEKQRFGRRIRSRRPESGQDAFFVSRVGSTGDVAFGVADGVGGWASSGIDSADFSHTFCDYMAGISFDYKGPSGSLRPAELMALGYEMVTNDDSLLGGGSTACIAVATADGRLNVANLGDSGYIQLRMNAVHHWSAPQTHAFNTPYQLSIVPPKILAQAVFGATPLQDLPRDSSLESHQLEHGDVLVFATDGVWDNLSSQDILKIVSGKMIDLGGWDETTKGIAIGKEIRRTTRSVDLGSESVEPLQLSLAHAITSRAKALSMNSRIDGPFAKEVQKYYPEENYHGGKVDDICTVVVVVLEN